MTFAEMHEQLCRALREIELVTGDGSSWIKKAFSDLHQIRRELRRLAEAEERKHGR